MTLLELPSRFIIPVYQKIDRPQFVPYEVVSPQGPKPGQEATFAQVLASRGVEAHYERVQLDLKYRDDGELHKAFTPDFYLPKYGLFVEMYQGSSKNIRHKTRKLQQACEIYRPQGFGFRLVRAIHEIECDEIDYEQRTRTRLEGLEYARKIYSTYGFETHAVLEHDEAELDRLIGQLAA